MRISDLHTEFLASEVLRLLSCFPGDTSRRMLVTFTTQSRKAPSANIQILLLILGSCSLL